MRSPWIDLLSLHGHITDPEPLKQPTTDLPAPPRPTPGQEDQRLSLAKQAVASLRLCLGIGDGVLREQ